MIKSVSLDSISKGVIGGCLLFTTVTYGQIDAINTNNFTQTSTENGTHTLNPQNMNKNMIVNEYCDLDPTKNLGKSITQDDLKLIDAVDLALCLNPMTQQAWIQTKIRSTQVKIAQSNYYPQVTASMGYSYGQSDNQYTNADYLTYKTTTKQYDIAIQANWMIFDFGQRHAKVQEAKAMLKMAFAYQNEQMQQVILNTILAYYDVLRLQMLIDSQKNIVEDALQNYQVSKARFEAGAAITADQLQMKANWMSAQAQYTQLNGEKKVAMGKLASLIGHPILTEFKIPTVTQIPELLNLKEIDTLIKNAIEQHPVLTQIQAEIEARQYNIEAIRREKYPTLSLSSSALQNKNFGQGVYDQRLQQNRIGLQLTIPLLDGFNRRLRQTAAQEELNLKIAEQDQLKYTLSFNVLDKYYSLHAAQENLNALKQLQESAEHAHMVIKGRYQAGVGQILEVLNAQRMLADANKEYANALTHTLTLRYELLATLGNLVIDSSHAY